MYYLILVIHVFSPPEHLLIQQPPAGYTSESACEAAKTSVISKIEAVSDGYMEIDYIQCSQSKDVPVFRIEQF
jgi:hypothetical protein